MSFFKSGKKKGGGKFTDVFFWGFTNRMNAFKVENTNEKKFTNRSVLFLIKRYKRLFGTVKKIQKKRKRIRTRKRKRKSDTQGYTLYLIWE
jgi:hypothetical protein